MDPYVGNITLNNYICVGRGIAIGMEGKKII